MENGNSAENLTMYTSLISAELLQLVQTTGSAGSTTGCKTLSTKDPCPVEKSAEWLAHAKKLVEDREKSQGTIATLETTVATLQRDFDVHKACSDAMIQHLRQELRESKSAQSAMQTRCNMLQAEKTDLAAKTERLEKLRTGFSRMSGEMQQLLGEGDAAPAKKPKRGTVYATKSRRGE